MECLTCRTEEGVVSDYSYIFGCHCAHNNYHRECIKQYMTSFDFCPFCRSGILPDVRKYNINHEKPRYFLVKQVLIPYEVIPDIFLIFFRLGILIFAPMATIVESMPELMMILLICNSVVAGFKCGYNIYSVDSCDSNRIFHKVFRSNFCVKILYFSWYVAQGILVLVTVMYIKYASEVTFASIIFIIADYGATIITLPILKFLD